ncbi:hypothetical protein [uncultured Kordia sp.]|uniref:hypothetical protein n=1 Tax=uncultured Kordia sp. TaxID=507699 RepID=UPI0026051689|nr:hypothetical protein [uncultured Kordia sp.]
MSLIKKVSMVLFLLATILTVIYLDHQIKNYNPTFRAIKGDGHLTRIVSVIILSSLFYMLYGVKRTQNFISILYAGIIGVIVGLVVAILCYILFQINYDVVYQMTAIILSYSLCVGLRKNDRTNDT